MSRAPGQPPPPAANLPRWPPPPLTADAFIVAILARLEVTTLAVSAACLFCLLIFCCRAFWRRRAGYGALRGSTGGAAPLRVCFELGNDLRETGELSLDSVSSVAQLRKALLQLADELLIDPEDDLGAWTLHYTDSKSGKLALCDSKMSYATVRRNAAELRVTAAGSVGAMRAVPS